MRKYNAFLLFDSKFVDGQFGWFCVLCDLDFWWEVFCSLFGQLFFQKLFGGRSGLAVVWAGNRMLICDLPTQLLAGTKAKFVQSFFNGF